MAKYGLLGDEAFFSWLEANGPALAAGDADLRAQAVLRSCEMKAEIVARDEKERGDRALLNLGHTFGHAVEAAEGFGKLLHGEAVAIGLVAACHVAEGLGRADGGQTERMGRLLKRCGLPTDVATYTQRGQWKQWLRHDKKGSSRGVHYVVPVAPGEARREHLTWGKVEELLDRV